MSTSPEQRMFNRRTQTSVPVVSGLLQPAVMTERDAEDRRKLMERQCRQYHGAATPLPELTVGQQVWLHPATMGGKENISGHVCKKREEPRSYDIELESGRVVRRNRQEISMAPAVAGEITTAPAMACDEGTPVETQPTQSQQKNMDGQKTTRLGRVVETAEYLSGYVTA